MIRMSTILATLALALVRQAPPAAPVQPVAAAGAQEPAVAAGVEFLRRNSGGRQVGETAMIALGMLKAEVPESDPALAACLTKIRSRLLSGGYKPERGGGADVYEAAVVAMALSNTSAAERGDQLRSVASYLMYKQKAGGCWDYDFREAGDTSISQYAVLGLWECQNNGVEVPPSVWDRAAKWYMSTQKPDGGWNYHPDQGEPETISMTAAGVGSLLICRRQLESYRQFQKSVNPYLTPVEGAGPRLDFKPSVSEAAIDQAVGRGMNWIAARFDTNDAAAFGKSIYYGLYGIERIGALSGRQVLGRVDWYEKGAAFIRSSQRGGGSWEALYGADVSTVWAMLFLTKSTQKSIKKFEHDRLGSGTLLGGRYLPSDLTAMTVAGGRIISRPMSGAVDGMLDVPEDPRVADASSALAGVMDRYRKQGPAALRPHKDRFRRMLRSRDPDAREVAAWALGRTIDLDVVPDLAGALEDADDRVVASARQGLLLISRKIDGPGPLPGASPEQKKAAASEWLRWYDVVRPLDASPAVAADSGARP